MEDERANECASSRAQGLKRKANASSSEAPFASSFTMVPTQHPPPPISSPRDTFHTPTLPNSSKPTMLAQKVAIPRLTRPGAVSSSDRSIKTDPKHRVTHACEQCRHRKTKCSGERPTCKHCEDIKAVCTYADGKRAMAKKVYHHMEAKVDVYQQLLLEISPQLDPLTQAKIRRAIDKEPPSDDDDVMSTTSIGKSQTARSWDGDGESRVSAGIGSTGSLDRINEDFNRNAKARATGFIGKASEVTWLHRLRDKIDNDSPTAEQNSYGYATNLGQAQQPTHGEGGDSTYHCDDMEVVSPHQVEPFEVPTRQTAEFLLHSYLESVHPTFPMIGKVNFRDQVRNYFQNSQSTPGKNWLAILNLIFAIGAVYSHVTQAEMRGDDRDHMIYFARARMLGMDSEALLAQPDLQRVQIAGLMSFYLMSINQINRSWTLCGLAMRHSVALGLHLRNEDPKLPDASKEIRYRVWWAVYGLERALAIMTGRPASVDLDCVTPLPLPIDEEALNNPNSALQNEDLIRRMRRRSSQDSPHTVSSSSSVPSPRARQSPSASTSPSSQQPSFDIFKNAPPCQALYFSQITLLSSITHDIMGSLYRSTAILKSWHQIQTTIASLDNKLERWKYALVSIFDFTRRQRDQQFTRERMILGFSYFSAKMIIHRPCLCRLDQRISNESTKSRDFNRIAAARCVQAARGMLDLIPDEPNPPGLYAVAPWWCLTHHLTQAATVLIMELFYRSEHMPNEGREVLLSAKKVVRWLNGMASEGVAARRAWRQCNDLLRRIAPLIGTSMDEMPTEAPTPPMEVHYQNLMNVQQVSQVQYPQFYGRPTPEPDLIFHPTMYNPFDETMPSDMLPTSTVPFISSMFPTASQMQQFAGSQVEDVKNHYYGPQGWDPMDRAN